MKVARTHRGGWDASGYIPVGNTGKTLSLWVGKVHGGKTIVSVTEGTREEHTSADGTYGYTSFTFAMFKDYHARLYVGTDRLTEKRARELYEKYLPVATAIAAERGANG